jgi:hypothetical protein
MKYVCFGYFDEEAWAAMSESEQQRFMDECFAYDAELRKNGQSILGGEALQTVQNAKTVRFRNGKVMITDGPYAETNPALAQPISDFFSAEESRDIRTRCLDASPKMQLCRTRVEAYGTPVVTARLTGNFPGSPVDLELIFTVDAGKIRSLEIK